LCCGSPAGRCSNAIQIHGGYTYLNDFEIARLRRDRRVLLIYAGTEEMSRLAIGWRPSTWVAPTSIGIKKLASEQELRRK